MSADDPLIRVLVEDRVTCIPDAILLDHELSPAARVLACLHYINEREPTDEDIDEAFGVCAEDMQETVDELAAWPRYEEYL